jgi:hypothetical protein
MNHFGPITTAQLRKRRPKLVQSKRNKQAAVKTYAESSEEVCLRPRDRDPLTLAARELARIARTDRGATSKISAARRTRGLISAISRIFERDC